MNKNILILFTFTFTFTFSLIAQNVNIETLKDDLQKIKLYGNISANSVYYNSNSRNSRTPFTYSLRGNLNFSWYRFNMPLSYTYSNQESNLDYSTPFKFDRLSLHPKYKWIQAHIGDASMTFSPYTLNGHQFTGAGIELNPNYPLKLSVMYGRLLRAVAVDNNNTKTIPSYKRIGYGTSIKWEKPKHKFNFIYFYAIDDINSIPATNKINPKENLVLSVSLDNTILNNYKLKTEYATTAITKNIKANIYRENTNLIGKLFNNRISTEYYKALKTSLSTTILKTKAGINYEHIDPNYETLGSYYFNNDISNITVDAARAFFENKINLSFNVGYQKDNLNNQKKQTTGRKIGSLNLTYQPNERISINSTYSNFTSFTNKNLNQFDDINNSDLTNKQKDQNFKQLSQNSNINLNWIISQKKNLPQNINFNYSLAASANEQNGIIRIGQANNFHNGNIAHTIGLPDIGMSISPSINYNYSDIGLDDSSAWGGNLSLSKTFFDKILNTSLSSAYNKSINKTSISNVLNLRFNATTSIAKKHNINLSAIQLFRGITNQDILKEFTATLGYSYSFNINKPKFKKNKKLKFSYKERVFEGTTIEIKEKIIKIINEEEFKEILLIKNAKNNLSLLKKDLNNDNDSKRKFKNSSLNYLDYIYSKKQQLDKFNKLISESLQDLKIQGVVATKEISDNYFKLKKTLEQKKLFSEKITNKEKADFNEQKRKYKGHLYMMDNIQMIKPKNIIKNKAVLKIKLKNFNTIISMINSKKSDIHIKIFLLNKIAGYYHIEAVEKSK